MKTHPELSGSIDFSNVFKEMYVAVICNYLHCCEFTNYQLCVGFGT
jgi:hypothetical protein